MGKSSSGRDRAGSEVSSRSERRRGDDNESSSRRSGTDSMTASSRRKSSRRDGDDEVAAFAPSITEEPSEIPDRRRNDSRKESSYDEPRRRSSKSERSGKDDKRRSGMGGVNKEDDHRDFQRSGRSSTKESERTRANGDHDNALPGHQFPGQSPDTYTQPYRPPGLASQYYGDHGESVQFQPGVRPNQPSIVTNAEQAHLMEPTIEAKPPAEPSSQGKVGAAAGYFGGNDYDSDSAQQTTPSKAPQRGLGPGRPPKHSIYGVSPRSSPGPQGNMPSFGQGPGDMKGIGAAAEYYGGGGGGSMSAYQTPNRLPPGTQTGSAPYSAPAGFGTSQNSNTAMYSGAAALTGAAAGAYASSHAAHQNSTQAAYAIDQSQQGTQMHHAHRHEHKGLLGRFVDWWRDPAAVAQYEQYTEAIGVCKYCFDPMSTAAEAPRRHNYRRRRPSSGSRYGSTTRVDKTYRYSSDEERRKRSSATKKVVLGGLAGYGVSKVGESIYKQHHDFDDAHSAKLARPTNQSRVSFQDEPRHERYGDVRLQRRNSDRKLSKSDKMSHKNEHRRRRSSSSSSNLSSHGISRGTVMSTGAAAAGLAVAAAALDKKPRRRSRSRSRSPTSNRKYFSKRVSPMHSYVDLSTTNNGPGGLMGFFTSPSANAKKGKKSKGLFNFANDSSSSSDADLRFGEGTVRRKASNKRLRARPARPGDDHSTAAMMGLVAAGTALAAEANGRHENGKRRHDANEYTGRNSRRASGHKISMDDHEVGGRDDEWYDTDGDAGSDGSVDTALAYGGGISAAQSRESLAQHRKSSRQSSYNFRAEDQRRYHDNLAKPQSSSPYAVPDAQGAALAGAAAMGGWTASKIVADNAHSPMGPLPPMQDVEPRPISDPPSKAVSPQIRRVTSTTVPLQQPQPVFPVAPFIDGMDQDPPYSGRQQRRESGERRRPRRDSSPAKLPTQDSERRYRADEQLGRGSRGKDDEKRGENSTIHEDRRKPGFDGMRMESSSKPGDTSQEGTRSRARRSSESTRKASDADQRVADIELELQRLYEESRQAEERKRKRTSGVKKVAEGVGIGAATIVAAAALAGKEGKTGSGDDSTIKRKSSMKKSRERDSSPQSETQQERIARMAAQRVRSTPSPVQHDDYSSFFVPVELKEHLKEHNDESEHRDDIGATVVEIVPGALRSSKDHPFDPFNYRQFGLELEDDPTLYPWPVPMLGLVEPTPPGSQAHSVRGDATPIIEPKQAEPAEDIGEPLERRSSKVTWGDHDTYVYEVVTPEYERSSYVPDVEVREPNPANKTSSEETFNEPSPLADASTTRPNVGRTWTLDETEAGELEKEIPVVEYRPQVGRTWTVDDKEADQIKQRAPTAAESARPDISSSGVPDSKEIPDEGSRPHSYYQSPFAESVRDLGITNDHTSFRPEAERPAKIAEEDDHKHGQVQVEPLESLPQIPSAPGLTKSEQRRRERASSSVTQQAEPQLFESERETSPPPVSGTDSVFDYMVDGKGRAVPSASVLGIGASAILAADHSMKSEDQHEGTHSREFVDDETTSKPKRSSTYDDSRSPLARSDSKTENQSDPEEWERSTKRKSKKSKSSSRSDTGPKTTSKSKAEREADEATSVPLPVSSIFDDVDDDKTSRRSSRHASKDADNDSTISHNSRDEKKKSKSRRSRDTDAYQDDDTQSITSSTIDSKGKKKDSGGFLANIFSGSKSDVSTSSRKSSKSESRADRDREDRSESRKKRKSRDRTDFDGGVSAASEPTRRNRRNSDATETAPDRDQISRDQSVEDGFVSAEESAEPAVKNVEDGESFLGDCPEMPQPTVMHIPTGTDGVSGLLAERESPIQPDLVVSTPAKATISATDDGPAGSIAPSANRGEDLDLTSSPILPQVVESRRLSAIRTSEIPSSPMSTGSPTAVPLSFRRPPLSPTNPRAPMSSPGAAPSSPLTTPRTRQGRPKSTEFRNSKEFRPLYLVERRNFAKTTAPEIEEDLPSLPSSRTSSTHPSMEDLRAEFQAQEQDEYFPSSRMSAEMFRERGRRHSHSYWQDGTKRHQSPDYLDSRSATPVPGEAQRARDEATKPKPRYEFHSPSELLQDPALFDDVPPVDDGGAPHSPLPSVASTELDQDYMSARSRSVSSKRARSLSRGRRSASTTRSTSASWHDAMTTATAGVLAGSVLGIAAHEALKSPPSEDSPDELTAPRTSSVDKSTESDKASGVPIPSQHRNVTFPKPLIKHPIRQETAASQSEGEAQITPEVTRDTGAWKHVFAQIAERQSNNRRMATPGPEREARVTTEVNREARPWDNIFAEIHKRRRGLSPIADPAAPVASDQVQSDIIQPHAAFSVAQLAPTNVTYTEEVAQSLPIATVKPSEGDEQVDRPRGDLQNDDEPQAKGIAEQPSSPGRKSKKSKKELRAEKKKRTSLPSDDAVTPEATTGPDQSASRLEDVLAASVPVSIDVEAPSAAKDAELDPSTRIKPAAPEISARTISDGRDYPSNELDKETPDTAEGTTESQRILPGATESPRNPLEQAFEAAFRARGLAEGATVEAAIRSFQPEIPDVGGTQLTTIQEETELAPISEQDLAPAAIGALVGRKASKKDKRKQSKSKQLPLDDWAEPTPVSVENADQLEPDLHRPQGDSAAERSMLENTNLAEPTPTAERPNPFGDDFDIKPREVDNSPVTMQDDAFLETSADQEIRQSTTKKGKKDKKKKGRQSYSWDEVSATEQAEADTNFTESSRQVIPIDDLAVSSEPAPVEEPLEENMLTPSAKTPQQELEDPWDMGSMPTKKKSKSKKSKTLPSAAQDMHMPAPDEHESVTRPTLKQDHSVPFDTSQSAKSQEARDLGMDDTPTPPKDLSNPDLIRVEQNTSTTQATEEPIRGPGVGVGIAAGAAVAAALLAAKNDGWSTRQPIAAKSDTTEPVPAARDTEDAFGGVTNVGDADNEEALLGVSSTKDDDVVEPLKADTSMKFSGLEIAAVQEPTHDGGDPVDSAGPAIFTSPTAEHNNTVQGSLTQQDEDFYPITKRKSRKDKKKKRTSAFDDDDVAAFSREPPLTVDVLAESEPILLGDDKGEIEALASSASTAEQVPISPAQTEDAFHSAPPFEEAAVTATPGEDMPLSEDAFVPAKKNRKDKKKKRQSTIIDSDVPASNEITQETDDQIVDTNLAPDVEVAQGSTASDTFVPDLEPEMLAEDVAQPEDDDIFPTSTKKGRKEKKKKRASTFVFDEPDTAFPETEPPSLEKGFIEDIISEDALGKDVPPAVDHSEPNLDSQSVPLDEVPRDDDAFDFTTKTKKSKKDKKKRRTLLDNFEEESSAGMEDRDTNIAFPAVSDSSDKALAVEAASNELPVSEPGPVQAVESENVSSANVAVETATVEPASSGEAPVVQSPSDEAANLDTHWNAANGSETLARRLSAYNDQSSIHRAVEIPVDGPGSVQAFAVDTPADEAAILAAQDTGTADLEDHVTTFDPLESFHATAGKGEAFGLAPHPVGHDSFEGSRADKSENANIIPSFSAVEIPSVETSLVETPEVETPANEAHPVIPGSFDTPTADDWGFPVKKSKKDKNKKRQSTVVRDAFEAEPPTGIIEQPSKPPAIEKETAPNISEGTFLEGDASLAGIPTQDDAQDEWEPTTKSKKDKKKKKRQSTLAEWEETESARGAAKDFAESELIRAEPVTEPLELVPTTQDAADKDNADPPDTVATEPDASITQAVAKAAPEDEWAFPSASSKKDKKKKKSLNRQSTFAEDMFEASPATAEVKAMPADPDTLASMPLDTSDMMEDLSVPAKDEFHEGKQSTVIEETTMVDEPMSRDIAEADWTPTVAKSKKDKKKKKRQSVVDSVEPAGNDSLEAQPDIETIVEPLAKPSEDISTFIVQDEGHAPALDIEQVEDTWAPAVKKKDKKKKRRSNLDDDFGPTGENQAGSGNVAMENVTGLGPVAEQAAAAEAEDVVENKAKSANTAQIPTRVPEAGETMTHQIPQPASTSHAQLTTVPAVSLQTNEAESAPDEDMLENQVEEPQQEPVQSYLAFSAAEAPPTPEEIAHAEIAGDHGFAESSTKDNAPQDQTLDYFSVSKKKSKKDKKKKRQATFDEPDGTDAFETPMEENVSVKAFATPMETSPRMKAVDDTRHTDNVLNTPIDIEDAAVEDDWATSTKVKSKKGKKKNRQSTFADIADDPAIAADDEAYRTTSHIAQLPIGPGSLRGEGNLASPSDLSAPKDDSAYGIPILSTTEGFEIQAEQLHSAFDPVTEVQPSTTPDVTNADTRSVEAFTTASVHQDRSNFADQIHGPSTTDEPETALAQTAHTEVPAIAEHNESPLQQNTESETQAMLLGTQDEDRKLASIDMANLSKTVDDRKESEYQEELSEQQPELPSSDDFWAPKVKKIKMKKRQSTLDEGEVSALRSEPASVEDDATPAQYISTAFAAQPAPPDLKDQPAEPIIEDPWAIPSKKSKKDKKKRQSTFDENEIGFSQQEQTAADTDAMRPQPEPTDIVAEPPILDHSTAEPSAEDTWAVSSKKSKKSRKSRQSTVDETAFDIPQPEVPAVREEEPAPQPEIASDTPMADALDESAPQEKPKEYVAEDEWATPTRGKKDKKKKRRPLLMDEESQPVTPADEVPFKDANMDEGRPEVEGDTNRSIADTKQISAPIDFATSEQEAFTFMASDDIRPETEIFSTDSRCKEIPQTEAPVADDEWAFSTKKTKKDKKKKKQQYLVLDDVEMDESEPILQAEQQESAPDSGINITAQARAASILKDNSENGVPQTIPTESFEPHPTVLEHMAQAPEVTVKEVEESSTPIPSTEAFDAPQTTASGLQHRTEKQELVPISTGMIENKTGLGPAMEEQGVGGADWPEFEKPKKEKRKSKRHSTFDDSVEVLEPTLKESDTQQVAELVDAPPAAGQANEPQPTTQLALDQVPEEDEWAFSTKKPKKKSKKGKALTAFDDLGTPGTETSLSTEQFESAAQTPYERLASPEPMEGVDSAETPSSRAEAIVADYFTPAPSKKKSKKEKKKKSLLAWDDNTPAEDPAEPIMPGPFSERVSPRDMRDSADVMTGAAAMETQDVGSTEHFATHEVIAPRHDANIALSTAERDVPVERWSERTPQQHHDPMTERQSSTDVVMHDRMARTRSYADVPSEESAWVTGETHQSVQDPDAQPAIAEPVKQYAVEEETPKRNKSKKDKKGKQRRGFAIDDSEPVEPTSMEPEAADTRELDVMETIPEENSRSLTTTESVNVTRAYGEFEDLSDVSESTRERRRRRRSPPVWSGDEPADLPRDGALTPPPEHDDMMDTALGVAAGLGFGGRESEPARVQSPKPPSPSRQPSTGWSFARLAPGVNVAPDSNRDSGVQFESPILATDHFASTRDSGYIPSPATAHGEFSVSREHSLEMKLRPPRPQSPTSSTEDVSMPQTSRTRHADAPLLETPKRKPSPVESTSKDRSSVLFNSSPAGPSPLITSGLSRSPEPSKSPLQRSPSIHGHQHSREELRKQKSKAVPHHEESERLASDLIDRSAAAPVNRSAFGVESHDRPQTPGRSALSAIREDSREVSPVAHPFSEPPISLSPRTSTGKIGMSAGTLAGIAAAAAASRDSGAKSLGRSKSRTSSLRNLRGGSTSPFDPASIASSSTQEAANVRDTGKAAVRDRDMADIYVS